MRKILMVIAPFIVLLIAWAAASEAELAGDTVKSVIKMLPYIIALMAVIMSVWFQSGNSFYLVFLVLVFYIFMNVSADKPAMLLEVVTMTSVLLPIDALWLAFSKERGVMSVYGRNKAILVFGQIIWIFIFMVGKAGEAAGALNGPSIGVKAPAIVLYVVSISIILSRYILKNQYMHLIYIVMLLMSFIALHFANRPVLVAVFTTAIFFIMVIAMFEASYSMVFYDALTGVLSRRALDQEALRLGNRYFIAMVDLDHFKHVNDNYGHDTGDEVLKMVASVMKKSALHGKIFRYGGEEFIVLYQNLSYNEIMSELEKIRKSVERRPFVIRADNRPEKRPEKIRSNASKGRGSINITVSIGVAQKNDYLKTCQDVIKKADEALYKSKNGGRNMITKA